MTPLEQHNADFRFNLELAGEVLSFGTEVYRRLATKESCDGIEHPILRRIREMTQDCYDMPIVESGEVKPCGETERMVWIGNHPLYSTQWIVVEAMTRLAQNAAAIGKDELLRKWHYLPPFLAWPAKWSGKAMFVSRTDHEAAVQTIQESCSTLFRPDTGVILFIDKHRPTSNAIKDDREKFSRLYPGYGIENWLDHTCFPSSTGLMQVLDGVPDARVVDFTSGLDQAQPYGATFYIDREEISQEAIFDNANLIEGTQKDQTVSDRELMLRGWLLKRYERKNKWLHERQI